MLRAPLIPLPAQQDQRPKGRGSWVCEKSSSAARLCLRLGFPLSTRCIFVARRRARAVGERRLRRCWRRAGKGGSLRSFPRSDSNRCVRLRAFFEVYVFVDLWVIRCRLFCTRKKKHSFSVKTTFLICLCFEEHGTLWLVNQCQHSSCV